jgi:Leucine-rich repeat (LRR) protein
MMKMTREYFKQYCERSINLVGKGAENSLTLREVNGNFEWWDVVAEFTNLESLLIFGGDFTLFDPQLRALKNIKHLGVRLCPLEALPEFLLEMPQLKIIYFQGTSMTELPSYIFEHPSLEEMHLEANKISGLPELFRPNHKLRKLSLANNFIHDIPQSFLKMLPNLEMLNLARNPLSNPNT